MAAHAQTIDLSWDTCAPIVVHKTAEVGPVSFYASVLGQNFPHIAYQVWWLVGDATDHIPDAWRFDSGACNGDRYAFVPDPPSALANACPPLIPAETARLMITTYRMAPQTLDVPTTLGNGFLAVSYPTGSNNVDPLQRYHVARFTFDFSSSQAGPTVPGMRCGGLDEMVTVRLMPNYVSWLDPQQFEIQWTIGNGSITFGGDGVPADGKTWGQIKAQYRR